MGLFSSPPEVDRDLAERIVAEEKGSRRYIEKSVAKSQAGLPALLEAGEEVRAITSSDGINELLIVTNRRLLRVKKGKMNWAPIPLDEIAETSLASRDLGGGTVKYMLVVDTFTSKQYAEQDRRRFNPDHFISVDFEDPRDLRATVAIIDLVRG